MSTLASISPPSGAADPLASFPAAVPPKTLGQDDFLKLLAQQFQAQDPLQPMDNTSFISQMAQFTSLQQSSAMSKDLSALRADQELVTANSYLGHAVTVDLGQGQSASGDVSAVQVQNGAPQLVIGGHLYPVSAVLLVQPAAAPVSAPNTPAP